MRHTPGPWQIESYPAGSKLPEELVIHTGRDVVAKLLRRFGNDFQANAQLISLAPELCQAVEDAALTLFDIGTHKLSPEAALPVADRLNVLLARLEEL